MRRNILFAITAIISSASLHAQTSIKLKFNQKLGTDAFTFNTQTTNNKGENYTITRLQYYVSQIIVVHDGGKLDTLKSKYLLIDPSKDTGAMVLGDLTLTTIEAIQFSVGVDKASNHKDPSLYASFDPLAPKSPSMHWGWSSGYRFIAIEGKSGNSMNLIYELHGLGDENYFSLRIPVSATDDNGAKLITLNADYNQVLKDISVKSGLVSHGGNKEDLTALQNMRDFVFTSTTGQGDILKTERLTTENTFFLYPNPVKAGEKISLDRNSNLTINIYNICGKLVKSISAESGEFKLNESGVYQIIAVDKTGAIVNSSKLLVQ